MLEHCPALTSLQMSGDAIVTPAIKHLRKELHELEQGCGCAHVEPEREVA